MVISILWQERLKKSSHTGIHVDSQLELRPALQGKTKTKAARKTQTAINIKVTRIYTTDG